jgi:hypothetical protein
MAKGFDRVARCSIYTQIFYGYVLGRQAIDPNVAIYKMATEFIKDNNLENVLDAKVINVSFIKFSYLLGMTEGRLKDN